MEGGTYKPLTQDGVERIHKAALDALEQIGLADAPPSGVQHLTNAGCILGDDGRIRFPRALVEDMLTKANRSMVLHSRDGQNDLELSGNRVHYGTAGAAVIWWMSRAVIIVNQRSRIFMTPHGSATNSTIFILFNGLWSVVTSTTTSRWT